MSDTGLATLFAELDPLPFPARMRLLARRARERAAAGTLRGLLDELWAGNADHRHLALTMGVVVGDKETVLTGLRDADWSLRGRALRATRTIPVEQAVLAGLLDDAPAAQRAKLYRHARHRPALAETLIGPVRTRHGDHEAARLLVGCSHDTVVRLLPELGYTLTAWSALARRHPGPVLDEAARQLGELPRPARDTWWSARGASVLLTARALPERLLDVLEAHPGLPHVSGLGETLGRLAAKDPAGVARLLADAEQRAAHSSWLRPNLLRRLTVLDTATLAALGRAIPRLGVEGQWARLLKAVAPARRGELFDALTAGSGERAGPLGERLLEVLPRARQQAEARRCLALPQVAGDEDRVLHYAAYLPFSEASRVLIEATRRHLPEARAHAYELLIACAVRSGDRAALGTVLGELDRLRNEQDPVRSRVISALAGVPPTRFATADAAALEKLTLGVVEARDASPQTREALGRLTVGVFAEHRADRKLLGWATSTFDRLFANRMPYLGTLVRVMRRGQEHAFAGAVLPWLKAGVRRARFEPLFAVVTALGRRAHGLPELQVLLRKAADPGNVVPVIRRGIQLWLDDRGTRAARVEEIVRSDTSTVALPIVWNTLCANRTDLIDLVLSRPPSGRHIAEGGRWVPGSACHLDRWAPRQRELYARLLAKVAGDAGTQGHLRASAIRTAATIPGHGWTVVMRYIDSPNVLLAEAALGALAWTDRPSEALAVLLGHVDGDSARVAAYAANRAALFTPPSRLRPLLAGILTDGRRLTSRKEAARLLARLAVPGAMDVLSRVWSPTLHRDLKVAVISAVRRHLDEPRAWRILEDAVDDAEAAVALSVIAPAPLDVAPSHRNRYGGLVAVACGHPRPNVAASAWTAYPAWAGWAPDATASMVTAVVDLGDRNTWRTAAHALTGLLTTVPDTDAFTRAVSGLLIAEGAEGHPHAGEDRDRPAGQRIGFLASLLVSWSRDQGRNTDRSALEHAGRLLAAHPDHLLEATGLMIAAADLAAADAEAVEGRLTPIADLLAERPVTAHRVSAGIRAQAASTASDDPHALWSAAERLAERGDLAGGLFALALAEGGAANGQGWLGTDPPWRDLLRRLRAHPEPEVRAAALEVATVDE